MNLSLHTIDPPSRQAAVISLSNYRHTKIAAGDSLDVLVMVEKPTACGVTSRFREPSNRNQGGKVGNLMSRVL